MSRTSYIAGVLGLFALLIVFIIVSDGTKDEVEIYTLTAQNRWTVGDSPGYKSRVLISITPQLRELHCFGIEVYSVAVVVGGDPRRAQELFHLSKQESLLLVSVNKAGITTSALLEALLGRGEVWRFNYFKLLAVVAFLLAAASSFILARRGWLAASRGREQRCLNCGYPTNSGVGVCPECGERQRGTDPGSSTTIPPTDGGR